MKKILLLAAFVFLAAAIYTEDRSGLLGLSLAQALDRVGYPDSMEVSRGKEAWMDDVVFVYPDGLNLYWFKNRVWSVQLTSASAGDFFGIKTGQKRADVLAIQLGPAFEADGFLYIDLPDRGWPSRLKIGFTDGLVSSLFLYRSDF